MSDALALPPRPNVEQYKKLARDFQQACRTADPRVVRDWAQRWVETLAILRGLPDTPEVRTEISLDVRRVERQWQRLQPSNEHVRDCTLAGAQLLVAHCHGFKSWPAFSQRLEAIHQARSPVSLFEAAVDAIVAGDAPTLRELLRSDPELIRARSTREHRSTLLHYVSANGVEDFRQKTPRHVVEIATLLLDAGADVNAESDAYGGRSTTLGLTATSYHPEAAGVQLELLDLLIGRGAAIDGPDSAGAVNACLRNGRGQAAEFLAGRGAQLDLEAAAGVGRLDIVKRFFDEAGHHNSSATQRQLLDGFTWACEFGQGSVVEFLLGHGIQPDTKLARGETGLHWAAYEAHADIVRLLLDRGASVDAVDGAYGGTPLAWALYAWGNRHPRERERRPYYQTVALLVRAGSALAPEWFGDDAERRRALEQLRSDARMAAALRGGDFP